MSYHFKVFVIITAFVLAGSAHSAEREDLLKSGKAAYNSQDYVTALKNLYAFFILNESDLSEYPEIKKSIVSKINKSEAVLKLSFASNNNVNMNSGKFTLRTDKIDKGFTGTGMEINDLLMNKSIDLNMMMQQRDQIYLNQ